MQYSLPRQSIASVVGLGLLAVGSSIVLIPHGREMALLQFRTGDRQAGLAMLEAQVAGNDHTPATLAALALARADIGNVDGAAQLLEDTIARDGDNLAALTMLEGFERTAGRTAGLVRTLQALQRLAPTIQRQREIAGLYAQAGRAEDQLQAVRDLIRLFPAEPAEFVLLARLEIAASHPHAAALALQALAVQHADAVEASIVGFEIGILLSEGEGDHALLRARDWLRGRSDLAATAPLLAGALTFGRRADLAVTLLEPIAAQTAQPAIVIALAQAESDDHRPEAGLQRLERLDADGATPAGRPAALLRLRLAVAVQQIDRAMAALDRIGLTRTPPDLLLPLAQLALNNGRPDVLRTMLATAGQDFLAEEPVTAARVLLALGERDAARRWSDRAVGAVEGHPDRGIQLAEVMLELGDRDAAVGLLDRALADPALPRAGLRSAASLYLRAQRANDGRLVLEDLLRKQRDASAEIAWALTATAAGHGGEVLAWLSAPGRPALPADVLQDLFYVANDAHALDLALAAARLLVTTRNGTQDKLLLTRALLTAGQPVQALDLLRTIAEPNGVPGDLRGAVLLAAWRQKAPVAAELRAVWVARLAAATTHQERDAAISLLLELHAYKELLPTLRTLVEQDPEHWLWSFAQVAKATGNQAMLFAAWTRLVEAPNTPALFRRQLAFNLLAAGNKTAAERAFRILAASAPSTSPDLAELLFIWGPRPTAQQLDWIEARARQANSDEKAAWMSILNSHGAPARAVAVYGACFGPQSFAIKQAYFTSLSALGNHAALAAAIRDELPHATTVTSLQQLAQLSERAGDRALQQLVLQKLVAAGGATPAALRQLGVLAYQARDMATAERHLTAFATTTGGDFETRMLLGDLALRRRDAAGARQHYAASLTQLDRLHEQSPRADTVRANLLHRLGRDDEAAKLYEAVLAAHPQDKNLRADYVAMLMEQGSLRRAQAVLANYR